MKRTRIWRLATATVAASAMLMTIGAGAASAQSAGDFEEMLDPSQIEDLLDPGQIEDLLSPDQLDPSTLEDILSPEQFEELFPEGGDGGESPSPEDLFEQLDPEQLQELLSPEQLQDLLDMLDLPAPGEDGGGDAPDASPGEGEATPSDWPIEVPEANADEAFGGAAHGSAAEVEVGLPDALADPLAPLLEGLGIAGGDGILIKLAETEAQLQRAGEGEEVDGLAEALATNLLLDSEAAGSPGTCSGGETVPLPPDSEVPLLEITLLNIDCEQDDEEAFADAQIAGVRLSLAGLVAQAGEDAQQQAIDGVNQALDPINEQLLGALNDQLTCGVLDEVLGTLLPGSDACEALSLQLQNPFETDIPVVDLQLIGSNSTVNTTGDYDVQSEAEASLAGLNVLGLVCVTPDSGESVTYRATATSADGTGTADHRNDSVDAGVCPNDENILSILSDDGPLDVIQLLGAEEVQDLLDGSLDPVFDGVDTLLEAINTSTFTEGEAQTAEFEGDDSRIGARVTPLSVAATAPLSDLPGLSDTPLGDISVDVRTLGVAAGADAGPDAPEVEDDTVEDDDDEAAGSPDVSDAELADTGPASTAGLLALASLGLGAGLRGRRRE